MKLSDRLFDQQVQFNVRIALRTRIRLDKYLEYMKRPEGTRPDRTADWPTSYSAIVREALDEWLANHQAKIKPPGIRTKQISKEEQWEVDRAKAKSKIRVKTNRIP